MQTEDKTTASAATETTAPASFANLTARAGISDTYILALCAEFEAAETAFLTAPEDAQEAAEARVEAIAGKIADTEARTIAGLAAKLKVLANDADIIIGPDWTETLILSTAKDAERLASA